MAQVPNAVKPNYLARRDPIPSPLIGKDYKHERYGYSLYYVEKNQLDEEIRELLAEFAGSTPQVREQLRARLSTGDFYTLLSFCLRNAVFALREVEPKRCAEAAMALAAIDIERMDLRDLYRAADVIDAAVSAIRADRIEIYGEATNCALSPVQEVFCSLSTRKKDERPSFKNWGYEVVDTPSGPILVDSDCKFYEPETDLFGLAVQAAEIIATEQYPCVDFTVGTTIPAVWLNVDEDRVEHVLRHSTGTALIRLFATGQPRYNQLFQVYFSELASEEDAAWFARVVSNETPGRKATVAFSIGRVVCVGVGAEGKFGGGFMGSSASLTAALEPVQALLSKWVE